MSLFGLFFTLSHVFYSTLSPLGHHIPAIISFLFSFFPLYITHTYYLTLLILDLDFACKFHARCQPSIPNYDFFFTATLLPLIWRLARWATIFVFCFEQLVKQNFFRLWFMVHVILNWTWVHILSYGHHAGDNINLKSNVSAEFSKCEQVQLEMFFDFLFYSWELCYIQYLFLSVSHCPPRGVECAWHASPYGK